MILLARYMHRRYEPHKYTCWSLVCDIYRDTWGIEIPDYTRTDRMPYHRILAARRQDGGHGFNRTYSPRYGCVVLMRPYGWSVQVHAGVYLDNGRIIHCHDQVVVWGRSTISTQYRDLEYYEHHLLHAATPRPRADRDTRHNSGAMAVSQP